MEVSEILRKDVTFDTRSKTIADPTSLGEDIFEIAWGDDKKEKIAKILDKIENKIGEGVVKRGSIL